MDKIIEKVCTECGETKNLEEFHKQRGKRASRCKLCKNKTALKYRQDNPDYFSEYRKNNNDTLKEKHVLYYQNNKESCKAYYDFYIETHPGFSAAQCSLYRAKKKNATPEYADISKILSIYTLAQQLTENTGISHHVDHIIPLRGKLVSGFHIETNLQILTATQNTRKSNKFIPGPWPIEVTSQPLPPMPSPLSRGISAPGVCIRDPAP